MGRGSTASGARKTDASRLRRDRYRKKYRALLRTSDDERLCQQIWAVWALQNGRPDLAARCIRFPREVVGAKLGDQNHIPPWILEALLNERFMLPPFEPRRRRDGTERALNPDTFAAVHLAAQCLRAAEDADQGVLLGRLDVMKELPRLLQRQFEWGRGFTNGPQVYRWAFLYGGELARAHFAAKTGLSIPDFILFGVLAHSQFNRTPVQAPNFDFKALGLDADTCAAALRLLCLPADAARDEAERLRSPFQRSLYQPSILRGTPVLAFGSNGERLRAPLPDLITLRVTGGLFYDLAQAPSDVRNEVGDRFEAYVRDLLNASLPGLNSAKGGKYHLAKRKLDLPDVLVRQGDTLAAVIECKARKMSFTARFGERPEDTDAVKELVKGVVQLWRFFAHDRLGLTPGPKAHVDTVGVLLTLENWTQMNRDLQAIILARAEADTASDPHIRAEDRRPVVFASIEDLETTLERSDETSFIRTLREARTERFVGWMLPNVFRDIETGVNRPYPMAARMGEVLPWWSMVDDETD